MQGQSDIGVLGAFEKEQDRLRLQGLGAHSG